MCLQCSFSNVDEAVAKEAKLKLEVNFKENIIEGEVLLQFLIIKRDVEFIVLDMETQEILSVTDRNDPWDRPLRYSLSEPGRLRIYLPTKQQPGCLIKINIKFRTDPSSTGLLWLTKGSFEDGRSPFLITHSSEKKSRAIFPCQDTPSQKITFTAEVIVPKGFTVIMSADQERCDTKDEHRFSYLFRQPQPISCSWFALVVGVLDSCKTSQRIILWAEKHRLAMAAYSLAELENILFLGEQICGKYPWESLNVILMPSSYPLIISAFPNCIYISLLRKSSFETVECAMAKGVSLGWMGSLVSPKCWKDAWLRDSVATFITGRILERVLGQPLFHLFPNIRLDDLPTKEQIVAEPQTQLANSQSYESETCHNICDEGVVFLMFLEHLVGGPARFEPFIREFLAKYKFNSLGSREFVEFFSTYFRYDANIKTTNWSQCLHGVQFSLPTVVNSLSSEAVRLAKEWGEWDVNTPSPFNPSDLSTLGELEIVVFLSHLYTNYPRFSAKKLHFMQHLYTMSQFLVPEIKLRWMLLCVQAKCPEQIPECFKIL